MRKLNLHWFCTQNHILEPFSVRRACTQCYVTSEPYPRPSQIWCQNVQETRNKIVIKCRGESFARCRVIVRYVEGGGAIMAPPPSLTRVKPEYIDRESCDTRIKSHPKEFHVIVDHQRVPKIVPICLYMVCKHWSSHVQRSYRKLSVCCSKDA